MIPQIITTPITYKRKSPLKENCYKVQSCDVGTAISFTLSDLKLDNTLNRPSSNARGPTSESEVSALSRFPQSPTSKMFIHRSDSLRSRQSTDSMSIDFCTSPALGIKRSGNTWSNLSLSSCRKLSNVSTQLDTPDTPELKPETDDDTEVLQSSAGPSPNRKSPSRKDQEKNSAKGQKSLSPKQMSPKRPKSAAKGQKYVSPKQTSSKRPKSAASGKTDRKATKSQTNKSKEIPEEPLDDIYDGSLSIQTEAYPEQWLHKKVEHQHSKIKSIMKKSKSPERKGKRQKGKMSAPVSKLELSEGKRRIQSAKSCSDQEKLTKQVRCRKIVGLGVDARRESLMLEAGLYNEQIEVKEPRTVGFEDQFTEKTAVRKDRRHKSCMRKSKENLYFKSKSPSQITPTDDEINPAIPEIADSVITKPLVRKRDQNSESEVEPNYKTYQDVSIGLGTEKKLGSKLENQVAVENNKEIETIADTPSQFDTEGVTEGKNEKVEIVDEEEHNIFSDKYRSDSDESNSERENMADEIDKSITNLYLADDEVLSKTSVGKAVFFYGEDCQIKRDDNDVEVAQDTLSEIEKQGIAGEKNDIKGGENNMKEDEKKTEIEDFKIDEQKTKENTGRNEMKDEHAVQSKEQVKVDQLEENKETDTLQSIPEEEKPEMKPCIIITEQLMDIGAERKLSLFFSFNEKRKQEKKAVVTKVEEKKAEKTDIVGIHSYIGEHGSSSKFEDFQVDVLKCCLFIHLFCLFIVFMSFTGFVI